ncbi:MAG: hypothetical protein EZS28_013824 [Streblomastix strix]|uniref:Uncharacterized protein n=1 Tax=Streblomastix strix TaxID=222440 RepID=A0A5J4W7N0_9EUKA|nr:MAG: hypothetical protein EZS28_013824 [Streblomastix strix]
MLKYGNASTIKQLTKDEFAIALIKTLLEGNQFCTFRRFELDSAMQNFQLLFSVLNNGRKYPKPSMLRQLQLVKDCEEHLDQERVVEEIEANLVNCLKNNKVKGESKQEKNAIINIFRDKNNRNAYSEVDDEAEDNQQVEHMYYDDIEEQDHDL